MAYVNTPAIYEMIVCKKQRTRAETLARFPLSFDWSAGKLIPTLQATQFEAFQNKTLVLLNVFKNLSYCAQIKVSDEKESQGYCSHGDFFS